MDLLDIYKVTLREISMNNPSNFGELLRGLEKTDEIKHLRLELGDQKTISYLQDIVINMIDNQLIIGFYSISKDITMFDIKRLSPTGYQYLKATQEKTLVDKVRDHAKENGISPTVENISKLLAKILWD